MKKISKVLVLVLILCLSFTSCGKEKEFSFSDGIDDNGYFKGVKALDYVTLPEHLDTIEISKDEIEAIHTEFTTDYFPDQVPSYDRAVESDDMFYMDYAGTVDGVALDGMQKQGAKADLLNNSYISGFLEQCVGHFPGETFSINVTFPDPYSNNPDLAGKDAVFEITINYVIDFVPATLDDDFVATNLYYYYGVSTVEELDDYIKQLLLEEYIIEGSTVSEVPEAVLDWVENCSVKSNQLYAANYYQVTEEEYLQQSYGVSTEEEFLEAYASEIKEQAEQHLIVMAIAEQENLSVTDADFKYLLESSGQSDYYDEYIEMYGLPYCMQMTMEEKILDDLFYRIVVK